MTLDEIESKIAYGEISAAQVFTQMKQHITPGIKLKVCPFCGEKMEIKRIRDDEFMALCSSKPGQCIAGDAGAAAKTYSLAVILSNKRITKPAIEE